MSDAPPVLPGSKQRIGRKGDSNFQAEVTIHFVAVAGAGAVGVSRSELWPVWARLCYRWKKKNLLCQKKIKFSTYFFFKAKHIIFLRKMKKNFRVHKSNRYKKIKLEFVLNQSDIKIYTNFHILFNKLHKGFSLITYVKKKSLFIEWTKWYTNISSFIYLKKLSLLSSLTEMSISLFLWKFKYSINWVIKKILNIFIFLYSYFKILKKLLI